ncbi:MAG: PPC domain-containing protein [Polyangiaceae bacterium]|nr:PPC domain-containing protein [Polyangiaceae bacterium]
MKFKVLSGLVGLAMFAGIGCGDDTTATGGSGGNGGETAGGGGAGTGGTPVVSTGGMGTGGENTGDGNDSFAESIPLEENPDFPGFLLGDGELDPADADADYFSFTGTAGQAVFIFADAKPDSDEFADGYIDTVLTIYDADENAIAVNDDPFPRTSQDSALYTILPATGTYYVKVEEFCAWASPGTCDTTYFDELSEFLYLVAVTTLDPSENSYTDEATEPNDTAGTASIMEYEAADVGQYYLSIAWGEYADTSDVDGVVFTPPADVDTGVGSRANASIILPPPGINGNGSSQNPGLLSVIDQTTMSVIAQFDMSNETEDIIGRATLDFPVVLGRQYLLANEAGPVANGPSSPFYFVIHSVGGGNPVETQEAANDVVATAEVLTEASGTTSYFVEGDLPGADVDNFSVAVSDETISVACGALRSGSGAEDLEVRILTADGNTELASMTETSTTDLLIADIDVGANTSLIVQLLKGGQSVTNVSNYYRCGIHFAPTAP